MSHVFYVVANMNRNIILGRDWLVQIGVRLYYDLGCLRVGNIYTNLEEDIYFKTFKINDYKTTDFKYLFSKIK
jgi:hypothetical protein